MRSRILTTVAFVTAAAIVVASAALVVFGGSGAEIPSTPTTVAAIAPVPAPTTTTTAPPTTTTTLATTTSTSTTSTSTTTTTIAPPAVIEVADGSSPLLMKEVTALYAWMARGGPTLPPLPDGMIEHLRPGRRGGTFEGTARVFKDEMADGTKVAVVTIGDDVILALTEGARWRIVGADLPSFGLDPWYGDPVRHVMVIGTDARPHQAQPLYRADSIHIIGANLTERGGAVVGFPRDTYVAASYGSDKYSSVNVRGGTDEMVAIAEDLSGIEMEGYVLTGFAGFKHLVNAFGGVEVDIPFRMADDDSNAFLSAGLQVLKGGPALAFSRNRHINGGDFTRSRHQGVVIKAGLTGAQEMGIEKLPRLMRLLTADTWTDLSLTQLLQLGAIAFELDPGLVGNVVLPGSVGTANGSSVVRLTSGAAGIFDDLTDGVISSG